MNPSSNIFPTKRARRLEVLLHVAFWITYFLLPLLEYQGKAEFHFDFELSRLNIVFEIFVVYLIYLWALPVFLNDDNKRKRGILLLLVPLILGIAYFNCWLENYLKLCNCSEQLCLFSRIIRYLILSGVFSLFYLYKRYQQKERELETIRKEKHLSELESLKSQINPHFILNTLNAIYSQSVLEDLPKHHSTLIHQFSESLQYVVYEGRKNTVALQREVSHIENFIALQKLRLEDKVVVKFDKKISDDSLSIAPLILITYIENAFKHTNDLVGTRHQIDIEIKEENGVLNFSCSNPLLSTNTIGESEGVGLNNASKRLELIYPKHHEFKIDRSNGLFDVKLRIDLK